MVVRTTAGVAAPSVLEELPGLVLRTAHDLNNSLARILGKAELALMMGDASRYRKSLEDVVEAGQSARILVSDLQRFALWCHATNDAIFVADVFALVTRLTERSCRKTGLSFTAVSGTGRLESTAAVSLAVALWSLCSAAAERSDASRPTEERWRLEASRLPSGGLRLRVVSDREHGLLGTIVAEDPLETASRAITAIGGCIARQADGSLVIEIPD